MTKQQIDTVLLHKEDLADPELYKVILHNDDYTSMEFVVNVLIEIFYKSHEEAIQIMLKIHHSGKEVCGIYPYEIAETKVDQLINLAEDHEFPLQATIEKL